MRLTEPTDEERDEAVGRFMPRLRSPWNHFEPDQKELDRLMLKSESVILGTDRFSQDEVQAIVSRMVRQSGR